MKFDLQELKKITILYVEDEITIREQTVSMFENIFNKTFVAENGAVGLMIFEENQNDIDIVISDINMPELSGLGMAEEIFSINDKIPFIITTAYTDEEYLLKSMDLNISKYITKPLKIKDLAISILEEVTKYKKENNLTKTTQALITKHMMTEKEVRQLQNNLSSNQKELAIQRDIINDFVSYLKIDKQGDILNASNKFCSLYGYKKDEVIDKNISMICENLSLIQKKILESIRAKSVKSFEEVFNTKDKKKIKMVCELYPLYENHDGLVSGYNLYQDIIPS